MTPSLIWSSDVLLDSESYVSSMFLVWGVFSHLQTYKHSIQHNVRLTDFSILQLWMWKGPVYDFFNQALSPVLFSPVDFLVKQVHFHSFLNVTELQLLATNYLHSWGSFHNFLKQLQSFWNSLWESQVLAFMLMEFENVAKQSFYKTVVAVPGTHLEPIIRVHISQ